MEAIKVPVPKLAKGETLATAIRTIRRSSA